MLQRMEENRDFVILLSLCVRLLNVEKLYEVQDKCKHITNIDDMIICVSLNCVALCLGVRFSFVYPIFGFDIYNPTEFICANW